MNITEINLYIDVENSESDKECHDLARMKARNIHASFYMAKSITVQVIDDQNHHFGSHTIERKLKP